MVTEQDIIEYVMHTPGNSNPAVLKSLVESYGAEAANPSKTTIYDGDIELTAEVPAAIRFLPETTDYSNATNWIVEINGHATTTTPSQTATLWSYENTKYRYVFLWDPEEVPANNNVYAVVDLETEQPAACMSHVKIYYLNSNE